MSTNSKNRIPAVTIALVGSIVMVGLSTALSPQPDVLLQTGANIPRAIRDNGEIYRLLTYILLQIDESKQAILS